MNASRERRFVLMRRMFYVLALAAVMTAMIAVMAAPAFALGSGGVVRIDPFRSTLTVTLPPNPISPIREPITVIYPQTPLPRF